MFLDLLEKATDAEKDDKGQMEFIAEEKTMPIKLLFINPTLYARGNPLLIGCR
ncbi:MAG: hypothetical protein CM15mP45_19170 [Deltaproteobacteria bacterium]|nr:MAG: hypothetical protein CM15mP45_19170 [Deltaproteobacteria bacterium]